MVILPLAVFGSPSNASSNVKVCPACKDEVNPQSFLPLAVARHGADPEQVRDPRPDIYPKAYPVSLRLRGSLYTNSSRPLQVQLMSNYSINAFGVFGGYSASVTSSPGGIVINSFSLESPQRCSIDLTVSRFAVPGIYEIVITDATGQALAGQIEIL